MDDYVIIVYLEVVDLDLDNNCQSPDGYFGDDWKLTGLLRYWWISCPPMSLTTCNWKLLFDKKFIRQLLLLIVFTFHGLRLVALCLSLISLVRQWLAPLLTEKHLKPSVSSNSMDEDRNRKDAALSHSDGGPLKRVRDPGGLTLRSGSVLKGRTLHMSQISDPQALAESSAVTAPGQAVISHSERESATTHAVSAAAADPSPVSYTHLTLPTNREV